MVPQFAEQQLIINVATQRIGIIKSTEDDRSGESTDITVTLSIQEAGSTLVLGDLTVGGANATTLVLPVFFSGKAFKTDKFTITNVALDGKLLVATYNSTRYAYLDGRQVIGFLELPTKAK